MVQTNKTNQRSRELLRNLRRYEFLKFSFEVTHTDALWKLPFQGKIPGLWNICCRRQFVLKFYRCSLFVIYHVQGKFRGVPRFLCRVRTVPILWSRLCNLVFPVVLVHRKKSDIARHPTSQFVQTFFSLVPWNITVWTIVFVLGSDS
jgi:hypothetical protein